ncbi:MAG: rRNA pseudouridine synthase [Chloroflexi bacterium]|nr:rRNA pseudouridine synthase [Chloroflexota bacterium]
MKERVQKLMAQANVGSRRAAESLIEQGRVRVNGEVVTLGDKADPEVDVIEVDGERLKIDVETHLYIAINKPKHVLTTNSAQRGDDRRTIRELVPVEGHLFAIGRLDADSDGLVVLTNDGDLAHRLTHPRFQHTKTYRVVVDGLPTQATLDKWQQGVHLEEGKAAPSIVTITKGGTKETVLRVVMTEGKKRQIRRVAAQLGPPVRKLTRIQLGMLQLGDMRPGEWRELTPREVEALKTPASELKQLRQAKAKPVRRSAPQNGDRSEKPHSDKPSRPARKSSGKSSNKPSGARPGTAQQSRPARRNAERSERGKR